MWAIISHETVQLQFGVGEKNESGTELEVTRKAEAFIPETTAAESTQAL